MQDNFSMNPNITFNSCLVLLTQHATMFGKSTRNSRQASGRGERNGQNGGRGGKNGGRGNGLGKIPETYKGIKITQIDDNEWYALTKEQQQKVKELRAEFYANRRNSGRGGRGNPGRGRGNPGRGRGNPGRGKTMGSTSQRTSVQEATLRLTMQNTGQNWT